MFSMEFECHFYMQFSINSPVIIILKKKSVLLNIYIRSCTKILRLLSHLPGYISKFEKKKNFNNLSFKFVVENKFFEIIFPLKPLGKQAYND